MSRLIEAEGLVLDRSPAGERHLRLTLITPAPGLLKALLRESGGRAAAGRTRSRHGTGTSARPDLFDHAEVVLEAPADGAAPGAVHFVREYKILRRHTGLARRYDALEAAAALARLVARHAVHFETCAPVFDLCRRAFAALEEGAPPEAVHLKALYLLARAEGYAAREQWLALLEPADRQLALAVLREPAATVRPAGELARLGRLRRACERWLTEHTDLETDSFPQKLSRERE